MAAKDLYEKDFYKVLGVDKKADADEIKKRYRALARDLHPDKTKGDAVKEEQFKAVSEAYEILSDPKKRAEYDEARSLFARGGFRAPQGGGDFGDIFGSGNPQDIFANLFGAAAGRRGPRKGQDLQTEATISFRESDLFIQLHVKPHPIFGRKGENLTLTLPVTFAEAALGADIKVPTLSDDYVTVRIAPGTPTGRTLRVKGRGVTKGSTTGDLLVTVEVQVPQRVDGKALDALKKFAEETASEDVRTDFVNKAKI